MIRGHRSSRTSLVPLFVVLVAWGGLPARLAAQDGQMSVSIQPAGQFEEGRAVSRASQGTNFTVRPSIHTKRSTKLEELDLVFRCIVNGQVIPFCDIVVTWQPRAFSGGHNHDGGRPRGTFEPDHGNSGASGELPSTYTAPDPSGIIDFTITGTTPNGFRASGSFTIGVEVPGLVALGAGSTYVLEGETPTHVLGSNHYGTPTFVGMLKTLADSYAAKFPGQRLFYNDMSLPYGGVFDVSKPPNWSYPHSEHRLGTSCDLNLVPLRQRRVLDQLLHAGGFGLTYIEGDHWHIRE